MRQNYLQLATKEGVSAENRENLNKGCHRTTPVSPFFTAANKE